MHFTTDDGPPVCVACLCAATDGSDATDAHSERMSQNRIIPYVLPVKPAQVPLVSLLKTLARRLCI